MTALHELSALDLGAAMRRREVSPREVAEHFLRRIEAIDASVGGFVTLTADVALEAAALAERRLAGDQPLPPLYGVPTAIKDLTLTAGVPTKFGSAVMSRFVAPFDDHVVTRLKEAGLISLGKTNTPEFGLPCYTEPEVAPPARTPFDLARSAGGSSGGAGAAVAAGLVPLAHGSDGAGSIRIPASACGLVGLKTSRGRVSDGPTGGDVAGLAVHGPLARSVRDAAALLDAMAGPMPGDPYWAPPLPPGETFLQAASRGPGRLRVGACAEPVIAASVLAPECVAAFDEAAALLESLGHEVVDCPPPFARSLVASFETIWTVGAASIPLPPGADAELRPLTRWLRARGRTVGVLEAVAALQATALAARQAVVAQSSLDAVLTPTLAQPPALVGELRDDEHPESDFEAQKRFTPFTAPANITGQPAISLPLHWTDGGLPIGVQLIGRPAGEAELLSLAAQLEAARPWAAHTPPCW